METNRNCAWLGLIPTAERPIVWSGGGAVAARCPVSTTGGEETAWLDLFTMWSRAIVGISAEWWAKDVDALMVLTNEVKRIGEAE